MSYKSQLFPVSGYSVSYFPADLAELDLRSVDADDAKVLRSSPLYDFLIEAGILLPRINWNAVLGIALATAVSAGIWAGVGFAIAQIWK